MRIATWYVRRTWLRWLREGDFHRLRSKNRPLPSRYACRRRRAEVVDIDGVRCVWMDRHRATTGGVIVYLHGGGYLFGPLTEQWRWLSHMTRRTGRASLLVDYRLTPEHPFPAGLDDATGVVRSLLADGTLRDGEWVLCGDSAGGGMCVAVVQRLRDAGLAMPNGMLLMSPWLDLTMSNPESAALAHRDPMLWYEGVKIGGTIYAGEHDPKDPLVSPLYCGKEGLPPMLIQGGSEEVLAPDMRQFALECTEAGVDVTYDECVGGFHVYVMAVLLPEGRRAVREQLEFFAQRRSQRSDACTPVSLAAAQL